MPVDNSIWMEKPLHEKHPGDQTELYLGLVVVLDAHGKDVDADDEGDEEVQVVARAQRVDGEA